MTTTKINKTNPIKKLFKYVFKEFSIALTLNALYIAYILLGKYKNGLILERAGQLLNINKNHLFYFTLTLILFVVVIYSMFLAFRLIRRILTEPSESRLFKFKALLIFYFLTGFIAFSSFYYLLMSNGSHFNGIINTTMTSTIMSSIYFTFITFFTIGYGDITPVSDFARTLVIFETLFSFTTLSIFLTFLFNMFEINNKHNKE